MARLFREVLLSNDYNGKFDKIVFAILEDKNSFHEHNPQGNLKPFLDEFSKD
jgi:hypothetical protein